MNAKITEAINDLNMHVHTYSRIGSYFTAVGGKANRHHLMMRTAEMYGVYL